LIIGLLLTMSNNHANHHHLIYHSDASKVEDGNSKLKSRLRLLLQKNSNPWPTDQNSNTDSIESPQRRLSEGPSILQLAMQDEEDEVDTELADDDADDTSVIDQYLDTDIQDNGAQSFQDKLRQQMNSVLHEADISLRQRQRHLLERNRVQYQHNQREQQLMHEEMVQRKWLPLSPPLSPPLSSPSYRRGSNPLSQRRKKEVIFLPPNLDMGVFVINSSNTAMHPNGEMRQHLAITLPIISHQSSRDHQSLRNYHSSGKKHPLTDVFARTESLQALQAAVSTRERSSTITTSYNNRYVATSSTLEKDLLIWIRSLPLFSLKTVNYISSWRVGLSSGFVAANILHAYFPSHINMLDYSTTKHRIHDHINNWSLLHRAMNSNAMKRYNNRKTFNLASFQKSVDQGAYQRLRRKTRLPVRSKELLRWRAGKTRHIQMTTQCCKILNHLTHDDIADGTIAQLPGYAVSMLEGLHFYISVTCGLCDTIPSMQRTSDNISLNRGVHRVNKERMVVSLQKANTWNSDLHSFCHGKLET
jgi:hypothetical protein